MKGREGVTRLADLGRMRHGWATPMPFYHDFSVWEWCLALVSAWCAGVGKAGLAGVGLLNVVLMAWLVPGVASSGVVLPMLIAADVLAVSVFGVGNVNWRVVRQLLGPMLLGVVIGWLTLDRISRTSTHTFTALIGWLVLAMLALQVTRRNFPHFDRALPHSRVFGGLMGLLAGFATMLANAAGPIGSLYLLILGFDKKEFVATMAWLFLIVNVLKVPFSATQGLITAETLAFNALLLPSIVVGFFAGKRFISRLPRQWFERVIVALTLVSALRLIW